MTTEPTASAAAATTRARRWLFADAVLDGVTLELRIDGVEAEIERKPLELLIHLLQHAGEVVTKDEILAAVWPGRILSDTVLTKCVGRLRDVLKDEQQAIVKTVHGYGYRLAVPVRVETQRAPEAVHFDFKPGDHPPGRSLWSLQRRLGAGGHGEAWLGQHDKTREQRVFKFAIDEVSLTALKREITLFRFLKDTLGEKARVVPLIDWNLEQPPCFVESEYIVGGSLPEWAERQGGLAKIPLETRIEIAAQIADSLAAIHAVGVLHKDLKPSNVLVSPGSGPVPIVLLADFGSGGVMDPRQLEALGITRLGFTKTVAAIGPSGGTPLYLAPELLDGQPPTVKADIYALGVMLYQLVVGEFRRVMNAGWEREVEDELLREDIAAAAEGDAVRRIADAVDLAQRLRSLGSRRIDREQARRTQEKVEVAKLAAMRARARRTALNFAWIATAVGFVVSTWMFVDARKARQNAELEAGRARAVTEFLNQGMLANITSGRESIKGLTVRELLDSAAGDVDKRFAEQPATAAEIHESLGSSYKALEVASAARAEFAKALEVYERNEGPGSENAVRSASALLGMQFVESTLTRPMEAFDAIRVAAEQKLPSSNSTLIDYRFQLAWAWHRVGDWPRAAAQLRALFDSTAAGLQHDNGLGGKIEAFLGAIQIDLGAYDEAERHLTHALQLLTQTLGPNHTEAAKAHLWLGRLALERGDLVKAQLEIDTCTRIAEAWGESTSGLVLASHIYLGRLRVAQQRYKEAIAILEEVLTHVPVRPGEKDQLSPARRTLAIAYARTGDNERALPMMHQAVETASIAFGADHPLTRQTRVAMADLLRQRNDRDAAWDALRPDGRPFDFDDLGPDCPANAELNRVKGLLWKAQGDRDHARLAFSVASRINNRIFGVASPQSQAVALELENL